MNTKDFIKTYCLSVTMLQPEKDKSRKFDYKSAHLAIVLKNGSELNITINTCNAPVESFCTAALTMEIDSTYIIRNNKLNEDIWNYCIFLTASECVEEGEARLSLFQLCNLIDKHGGISFEETLNYHLLKNI